MAASTFDTLAAADELRKAGFDERQARAMVAVQHSAHTTLATKAELAHLAEQIATLAGVFSMMKRTMGFIGVVMLAMAGRLFDIV